MQHIPEIAIVEQNTLTALGLQTILEELIPVATIRRFSSFARLIDDTPDMYSHYFVSAQTYFEHTSFFSGTPSEDHRAGSGRTASAERCPYPECLSATRQTGGFHHADAKTRTRSDTSSGISARNAAEPRSVTP